MKILLLHLFLLSLIPGSSQAKPASEKLYKGYYFQGKSRTEIKYSVSFLKKENDGEVYVTSYIIYDATGKKGKFNLTVGHNFMLNMVTVDVFDLTTYENINTISIFYENASTEPFGNKHEYRKDAYQAKVRFANSKSEYVKLIEGETDLAKDEYFVLNDPLDVGEEYVDNKSLETATSQNNTFANKINSSQYEIDSYSNTTDVNVKKGDRINIAASGTVTYGAWAGSGGPDGIDGYTSYNRIQGFRHGSLLVRIGDSGDWEAVGTSKSITAKNSGPLQFIVNDGDPSNNSGSFTVVIKITR